MNIKQKTILRKLVQINGQRFSQLYSGFSYDDKFPYHLKQLLRYGLIKKRNNLYFLTKKGMQETAHFDTRTFTDIRNLHVLFTLICTFKEKYYIIKHFSNDPDTSRHLYTLPSARPIWGVPLGEAAHREAIRKYNLDVQFTYQSTFRLINFATDGDALFDDVFLVYRCEISEEAFNNCIKKDYWLTLDEIKSIDNRSILLERLVVKDDRSQFIEDTVVLNYGVNTKDLS